MENMLIALLIICSIQLLFTVVATITIIVAATKTKDSLGEKELLFHLVGIEDNIRMIHKIQDSYAREKPIIEEEK